MVCLFHDVSYPSWTAGFAPCAYLMASKRQAETPDRMAYKVNRDDNPAEWSLLGQMPRASINEFAYAGPFQFGDWLGEKRPDKSALRKKLEAALNCKLDPAKPIVAFFIDEFCEAGQLEEGIRKLAPEVNLIIKIWSDLNLSNAPGLMRWPHTDYAPNLLRFAADFILAGYHSGTLVSSSMAGLRVIPYYTPLVHTKGARCARSPLDDYRHYLPGSGDFKREVHLATDVLKRLNSPVNLLDTAAVLDRVYDGDYWAAYEKRLPAAQKEIFGDYDRRDPAGRAAKMLMRYFETHTFGDEAVALALRPEAGSLLPKSR